MTKFKNEKRTILMLILDLLIVFFGYNFSFFVTSNFDTAYFRRIELLDIVIILSIFLMFELLFDLHQTMWSKVSIDESMRLSASNFLATIVIVIFSFIGLVQNTPLNVIIISLLTVTLLQFSVRAIYRMYRITKLQKNKSENAKRVLIYGAGSAGKMIAREILENEEYNYNVVGFIDDDDMLKGKTYYTVPVFGNHKIINSVVAQYSIDEIFLAIPSLSVKQRRPIVESLIKYNVDVKIVASAEKLLRSSDLSINLKKIDIADLLERGETVINCDEISSHLKDKTVMVTGAGGSIGSELVRQIIEYEPKKLILVDMSELALYDIEQELKMKMRQNKIPQIKFEAHISNITDERAMRYLFEKDQINIIFHAAAYKHVPLMEAAPLEAIKNNIFGSKNLIDLADEYKIEKFTNISTDKAVNPTNVMGATKRFIEMMLQAKAKISDTQYVAVRFGNVLGSNGSAVPLFRKQISEGGPVTVTHKDIERYFMTIPEAVSLVLQASSFGEGGEIYVLDMGEPVKILHLAEKVIELSGYKPYEDIDIEITGLRPGEKLYEELFMDSEDLAPTQNKLILKAKPMDITEEEIEEKLKVFHSLTNLDFDKYCNGFVNQKMQEIIPTYNFKEGMN